MKCRYCGISLSFSVLKIHELWCKDQNNGVPKIKEKIENIQNETDLTKGLILQELKRKDIPHNPRDKKEVLLQILNESKEAE
jgi:hypothetical protein